MRVGIVCEGTSDFAVLEALAIAFGGASECVLLQPDVDRLRARDFSSGTGWQAVRRFLRDNTLALGLGMFDAIVVQVDASVRRSDELTLRAVQADEPDLTPLCDEVKNWAGGLPENAIVALPREELESWLLAAHTRISDVEGVADPVQELVDRKLIGVRANGKADKDAGKYRNLAKPLVSLVKTAKKLSRIPELERFLEKLRQRAHAVRRARR
jgi:hypothetical protein